MYYLMVNRYYHGSKSEKENTSWPYVLRKSHQVARLVTTNLDIDSFSEATALNAELDYKCTAFHKRNLYCWVTHSSRVVNHRLPMHRMLFKHLVLRGVLGEFSKS